MSKRVDAATQPRALKLVHVAIASIAWGSNMTGSSLLEEGVFNAGARLSDE